MGRGKIVAISLVLVMVLSFTACGEGGVEEGAELPSTEATIVSSAIMSWAGIRTYQFDMDVTVDMAGEAEDETFEVTMVMDSSGALDLENDQMKMDATMNMTVPGEDEMEMEMGMYLIADMMYMMMDIPEIGPMWMKSEVPVGYWEQMNQIEQQMELLKTAEVEVTGSETVKGVDCYVLEITPDMEQLWQVVMQQAEATGEAMPYIAEESLNEVFRSFSVKQWIAKDTYFLAKAEIDIAMELTPEAMGFPGEEGEMTMDMGLIFMAYNYNQPVSIVLPREAEEAVEMPMEY